MPSRAATGQDAGSTFANPLLAAPGSGDFHLATGSPAINAGDPGFTPAVGEVVQLHSTTGACWGQTYSAPATRNDTGRFKDKL